MNIVELGTGLAVSSISMAVAAKLNGLGHLWTVDNFEYFRTDNARVNEVCSQLRAAGILTLDSPSAEAYYTALTERFGVDSYVTFLKSTMKLTEMGHFNDYPFVDVSIDLLFSDFMHDPSSILALLGHFLPKMSPSSSIFIDSAPTMWPSYLLLENLTLQWNSGRVPQILQDLCEADLDAMARRKRLVLVNLTERRCRAQNSTAWLKVEPVDLLPYPETQMRHINPDLHKLSQIQK